MSNMSTPIDLRTIQMNLPSLCIPRVFPNINESRIYKIFNELNLGDIERIDIVSKKAENGDNFNRIFVHFSKWNNGTQACEVRSRLLNGKEIKIIYDEPWFWKVSAYRPPVQRPKMEHPKRTQNPVATILLEDDNMKHIDTNISPQCIGIVRPAGMTRMMSGSDAWMESGSGKKYIGPPKFTRENRQYPSQKSYQARKPVTQEQESLHVSEVTRAIMEEPIDTEA